MVLKFIAIAFLAVAATRLHAESPHPEIREWVTRPVGSCFL